MARTKSIETIDTEIEKIKNEMIKVQEKYDKLAEKLQSLQEAHKKYEAQQILDAYVKSGKTYRELMTFLGA